MIEILSCMSDGFWPSAGCVILSAFLLSAVALAFLVIVGVAAIVVEAWQR